MVTVAAAQVQVVALVAFQAVVLVVLVVLVTVRLVMSMLVTITHLDGKGQPAVEPPAPPDKGRNKAGKTRHLLEGSGSEIPYEKLPY